MKIIIGIIIFSLTILIHELGHFLLAKKNGIQVNEFCLGFGPTIIGKTIGETKYSLKLLPFGGACMMQGEDEDDPDNPRAFCNQSVWARIQVVLAGPIFNFILAFVLALIVVGCVGIDQPVIGSLHENGPAAEAGLKAGDRIISINGDNIVIYREIANSGLLYNTPELKIIYERAGEQKETILKGIESQTSNEYYYGFRSSSGRSKVDPIKTIGYSFNEVGYWIRITLKSLGQLLTGKANVNDMQGPVGIVNTIGQTYERASQDGAFYIFINMVNIAILLTANLGVMNLLPIPALDGGRFVLLVIEGIRKKRFNPDIEGRINVIFFMLLLALMVYIMINDVIKLF